MDMKKLEKIIGIPPRIRPDGFGISVTEYCEIYGCGKKLAQEMLNSGVDKGLKKEEMCTKGKGGKVVVYYIEE